MGAFNFCQVSILVLLTQSACQSLPDEAGDSVKAGEMNLL